jgi:hypothetical protein
VLKYAGVDLESNDPAALARVAEALSLDDLRDFARRTWPGRLAAMGWPWMEFETRPILNRLVWPCHASRWAMGWFLTNDAGLALIRPQAYRDGKLRALPFVMDDDNPGGRIAADLYLLPPRPLGQCGTGIDQYLICLVDERYFWWQNAKIIDVFPGVTTWAALFAAYAAALGSTFVVDAVPAAYLLPSSGFDTQYEFLPPQVDAACRSVGMRLYRTLDGVVHVIGPGTATTTYTANLKLKNTVAGGQMDMRNVPGSDLGRALPQSVTIVFPSVDAAGGPVQDTPVTNGFAAAGFNTPGQDDSTEMIRTSMTLSPFNIAQANAYALQLTKDWYAWQAAAMDVSYSGACPWIPGGMEDRIEWNHLDREIWTRVQRAPWNQRNETAVFAYGSAGSTPQPGFSSACDLSVTGCTGSTVQHVGQIVYNSLYAAYGGTLKDGCNIAVVGPSCTPGGGGGITVVNLPDITTLICSQQLVFNLFNATLNICVGGSWFTFCPCAEGSGSGHGVVNPCITYDCTACLTGASLEFNLTLTPDAPMLAGACDDQATLLQTFTLFYTGGCVWESADFRICTNIGGVAVRWFLDIVPGGTPLVTLQDPVSLAVFAQYGGNNFYNPTPWDCDSQRYFTLIHGETYYRNWSKALSLVPVCGVSGSGGSGSGGGTVAVGCCPGVTLPTTLYCTLTNASGTCGCLAGSYALTYGGTNAFGQQFWRFTGTAGSCHGEVFIITLTCGGSNISGWQLQIECSPFNNPLENPDVGSTCSPLALHFTSGVLQFSICCNGTVNAVVTT